MARISRPGEYRGYSRQRFDGHERSSLYVSVRDGTKLALDIFRPTQGGALVAEPLPVVWMHMTYNRRVFEGGPTAETYPGAALALVKYGYVVAIADMRGSYASHGWAVTPRRAMWQREAFWDAYDITEWLAAQPWSDGNIGMWGCSATGHSQWQAAASNPPHLKAIMPLSAPSEYYDINGVTATEPLDPPPFPAESAPERDRDAAPVDADGDGAMLAQARDAHRWNIEPGVMPFRDSASPWLAQLLGRENEQVHLQVSTFTHFPQIEASGIPYYQSANWGEDYRVKSGVAIKLNTLSNPSKTIFVPGKHCIFSSELKCEPSNAFNINAEALRWFDYWLKGVDNGIMSEPPIYYYVYNARSEEDAWRFADKWPLPDAAYVNFYLDGPGESQFTSGVNRGRLALEASTAGNASDGYRVDYSVTAADRDRKGMSFTTDALPADMEVIGHPIVRLWIASTATDNDFIAFLYDVDPEGKATPIPGTDDGQIRASLRKLNPAPFDNSGLPYHRCYAEDHAPLTPGEPVELAFDLAPLAYNFQEGHRIRLVISCVAVPRPGAPPITPVLDPPPLVSFYRDASRRSHLALPVLSGRPNPSAQSPASA
ncbi:MAG: hypothetical protein ABS76_01905 [Pelagibacterium sp. SCN 64-44]|nr:MAG: hypothetical protein ABS76_01905 [Pelagibacterium sp. SCN 64-44]